MNIDFYSIFGSITSDIRNRGKDYYSKGRVKNFTATEKGDAVVFRATVVGTEAYHTSVSVNANSEVDHYKCECEAFYQYDGLCKHCAALLYEAVERYCPTDSADGAGLTSKNRSIIMADIASLREPEITKRPADPVGGTTDRAASSLLSTLMADELQLAQTEPGSVHLEPELKITKTEFTLRFSVGMSRRYVVRSIADFMRNVDYGFEYRYGKGLSFKHIPEVFDPKSLELIKFLRGRKNSDSYYAYGYYSRKDEFVLTDGAFDEFFSLYRDSEITVNGKPRKFDAIDIPAPEISVKRPDAGGMMLKFRGGTLFSTDNVIYAMTDTALRRFAPLPKAARQLLLTFAQNKSLSFSDEDAVRFCGMIMPTAKDRLKLTGDVRMLEELRPEEMYPELYLDAPERELITCKPYCRYGEDRYVSGESGNGKARHVRNLLAERQFDARLKTFFARDSLADLTVEGNDAIYTFLTERLDDLRRLADIKVSDRLKRLTVSAPKRVAVGVSMASGILKLELASDGIPTAQLAEILSAYRERRRYYRLPDGAFIKLGEELSELDTLCDQLALTDRQIASGEVTLPAYRVAYLDGLFAENRTMDTISDEAFRSFSERLRSAFDSDDEPPASLAGILRPYQTAGYRWLRRLESCSLGGILADEMGLGKTLQVIALLCSRAERGEYMPSLVVCPASLVFNWKRELEKFAPGLAVRVVSGTAAVRASLIADISNGEVVVTSYDLLKNDIDHYGSRPFGCCIVDEAQYIKNHGTLAAKAVRQINSAQRFALTGTPIENRLSELWSIFDFLMPGYLYGYTRFKKRFEVPIAGGDAEADKALRRLIAPFVLRRVKRDVLRELPPKTEAILPVEMGAKQSELYRAALAVGLEQLHTVGADPGESKLRILALLTKLRQICCDPALCYENYHGPSAKTEACLELLQQAKESGHRVLLFSQFTTMLERLEPFLIRDDMSFAVIRGSTRKDKRLEIADRFNAGDYDLLLVSLKAGGTGLNLIGADTVIHFDPWWNLAAESQATDRTHRIGQTKTVQVYKLIATGTVEEKVVELQNKKRELASLIDGEPLGQISSDELLSILGER